MINPEDANDRIRLSSSMDYWHRQMVGYREDRRETILNLTGSTQAAQALGVSVNKRKRQWGNLLQMSANSNAMILAYNTPRYLALPNTADADQAAPHLQAFLNRYSELVNLGDIARQIAVDAFAGWGIAKVAHGMLSPGARMATGSVGGPMCWRVSQDNFLFDGTATSWDYVSYQADMYLVPLKEAQNFEEFLAYNEEGTRGLQEFTLLNNGNSTDSRIHTNPTRNYTAQGMTRILYCYLPHSNLEVFWAANRTNLFQVREKPLLVREWRGHHNGPFSVMSMLDIPDNLIPVAKCESTKQLHYLFNDLADITANQGREGKIVPVYETGSQRDMEKLESGDDRKPVGVSNIQKIGIWEKPGASQSQTAQMLSVYQLYKEVAGNLDDTLGLGPTAGTATQSALIRQRTSATAADARRRMDDLMTGIGEKLAKLALIDENLTLPVRNQIPGTDHYEDVSWHPVGAFPRPQNVMEFNIKIVPESMAYRDPMTRLQNLNEGMTQIIQAAQVVAQGVPLDLEAIVKIQAELRDEPLLLRVHDPLLQQLQMMRLAQNAQGTTPAGGETIAPVDPTKGQYTRTNVSQRSNQGAMVQNMSQVPQTYNSGGMVPTTPLS